MKIIFDVYGSVVLSFVGIMLAFAMMITVADTLKQLNQVTVNHLVIGSTPTRAAIL